MGYLSVSLINSSDNLWYVTMEKVKRKKKKMKKAGLDKTASVGMGMAIGIGMIGAIIAVKSKIFN